MDGHTVARLVALAAVVLVLVAGITAVVVARRTPRADRDWAVDQARPARIAFGDGEVRIENLRDFRHRPGGELTVAYREETVNLADVRRVWFVLAPFASRFRGLAHSLLSFELTGDRFIAISVEARRERGEEYSLIGGMLRRFEVTYVVATEQDIIGLRAVRGDRLFLYPSRATPEQAQALFVDMLNRAEAVRVHPEFYNTFFDNCTTNLRTHVNRVLEDPLPWGWGVVLPGYSDRLALEHGILDTELPLEEARRHFRVDERARAALAQGDGAFGRLIREGL